MKRLLKTEWLHSDWFFAASAFLVLVTFVVSQSVYEVLAANQEFLAVRGAGNQELLEVVLVFNLLPALILFVGWTLLHRARPGLARGFFFASVFVFLLAFFLQLHNAYVAYADWWLMFRFSLWERQPWVPAYWLWALPAALLVWVCLRFERQFRSFVWALSPVVLVFPGLFLAGAWTSPASHSQVKAAGAAEPGRRVQQPHPPVFLLVFDELALPVLLDESGRIDRERFPHFRRLAEQSYWFRNATANADHTTRSISVLLSGRFPRGYVASYEAYPNNLLALLAARYEIYAYEAYTHFCHPGRFHCPEREIAASRLELLRDISYFYLARVLPAGADVGLPAMGRSWGPFREPREEMRARLERFEQFLASLDSFAGEGVFVYFHHLLPHSPYLLTPAGEFHEADVQEFPDQGSRRLLRDLLERYEWQIRYTDKQLGRLLARLKALGLYEKSLLIITADHGVSYRLEAPGRFLEKGADPPLLLSVPLFIKLPHQERQEVSDKDVQLIDILPTVADLLDIPVAWPHAGRSAFAGSGEKRGKIAYDRHHHRYEFPGTLGLTAIAEDRERFEAVTQEEKR